MLFLDHSSPRPGHLPESWLMENSPLFSPSHSPSTSASLQQQHSYHHQQQQSPLVRRHKRRLSDGYQNLKKPCTKDTFTTATHSSNDWPVFNHPQGGIVQQSPYGNIRVMKVGNTEVSRIDKTIGLDVYTKETKSPTPPPAQPTAKLMSPSPSVEVEGYMLEGYQRQQEINKSYSVHQEEIVNVNYSLYDQSHEDEHLAELSENDYEMAL